MTAAELDRLIALACDEHGPRAVHDAADRALRGDGAALAAGVEILTRAHSRGCE